MAVNGIPFLLYSTGSPTFVPPPIIPPEPRPPPSDSGGAGYATGPAFPRRPSVREMYRQPRKREEPTVEEVQQGVAEVKPQLELSGPSPLPILMNIGGVPVAIGIELQREILADDEEAIFAILSAQ